MVDIFLLRHAEAGHHQNDEERQLTPRGRRELLGIISASAEYLEGVQHIWVSPYVRAQQTLALAQPYLPDSALVTTTEWLTPEQPPLAILPLLQAAQVSSCLLVGHQPLLGSLLNSLCNLAPGQEVFGTSALASMTLAALEPGCGQLHWLRQP